MMPALRLNEIEIKGLTEAQAEAVTNNKCGAKVRITLESGHYVEAVIYEQIVGLAPAKSYTTRLLLHVMEPLREPD